MLNEYKETDIAIMIPNSDGTPVSGIETMLSMTPLIIGNIDYDEDIFNDKTVWKVNHYTPKDIYNKIDKTIKFPKEKITTRLDSAKKQQSKRHL